MTVEGPTPASAATAVSERSAVPSRAAMRRAASNIAECMELRRNIRLCVAACCAPWSIERHLNDGAIKRQEGLRTAFGCWKDRNGTYEFAVHSRFRCFA